MALLSQITGTPLANIRANKYHGAQYVALDPMTVVYQAQPSSAPATTLYAQISMGTAIQGALSAVKSFQLVIFSDTSDYRATEKYRTYIRAGSSGSTLNVAQNNQVLTTSMYVTVINTYAVFEKPLVERAGVLYADWNIAARRILPVETALPTAVVITNGATSWQPTAIPSGLDANANGTFTYSWSSSNGSDSFSSTTVANPTVTLQAASFRWVRLEFTNTGTGLTNLRVIAVWTVPANFSSVITLGFGDNGGGVADIGYDKQVGFNCTLPAWSGINTVMAGTFLCVFSDNTYNGTQGAIRTNIDFVGYLGQESTRTRGDEQNGVISEVVFNCNSLGSMIAETPVSTLSITATDTPTNWLDIEAPTPVRVAHLMLSELSTVGILCSMSFNSDHTDFVGNGDVFSNTPDVLYDSIFEILDTINAVLQYDVNGRMDICRNLVELDDTARNAATTVVQLSPADFLDYTIDFDPVKRIRQLVVAGGWFDSSFNVYTARRAYVPPIVDNRGVEKAEVVNQVLTTDSTDSDANAELAERAANKYAALNPAVEMNLTLKDEWYFLVPDVGTWFTFSIALTDTARGVAYSSTTRWQLIGISYRTNNNTGRRFPIGRFRIETQDTGAFIEVTAPQEADSYNPQPITAPPYTDGSYDDWWDDRDPAPPENPNPPTPDCEQGGFRIRSALGYTTERPALLGEQLRIGIQGNGGLQGAAAAGTITVDFDAGYANYTTLVEETNPSYPVTGGVGGGGNPNNCLAGVQPVIAALAGVRIILTIDLGEEREINNVAYDVWTNANPLSGGTSSYAKRLELLDEDSIVVYDSGNTSLLGITPATWLTGSPFTGLTQTGVRYVKLTIFATSSGIARAFEVRMDNIIVTLAEKLGTQGDAFYQSIDGGTWQAYGTGDGLLIQGSQPASIPPYNSEHYYELLLIPNIAGVIEYEFESPYARSEAENWSIQTLTCFLGVP